MSEVRDVAPGLWIWQVHHPAWKPGFDWGPMITSTCVESGSEVALLDPLAPSLGTDEVWERLDAEPPSMVVILKPDHVRDVDRFVRRYGGKAFGPYLFGEATFPRPSSNRSTRVWSCPAGFGPSTTGATGRKHHCGYQNSARSFSRTP